MAFTITDKALRLLFRTYFQLHVFNQEKLPRQSFILASNHASHMDSIAVTLATQRPIRDFCFLAARDYYFVNTNLVRKLAGKFINLIPFDRQSHHRSSGFANNLAACAKCITEHKNLVIYPEATRSPDGEMRPFKSGASIIACELNIPIVPAYIKGSYQLFPKGNRLPKPGKISVAFGEAISVTSYKNSPEYNNDRSVYRAITKDLENAIIQLKQEYA